MLKICKRLIFYKNLVNFKKNVKQKHVILPIHIFKILYLTFLQGFSGVSKITDWEP